MCQSGTLVGHHGLHHRRERETGSPDPLSKSQLFVDRTAARNDHATDALDKKHMHIFMKNLNYLYLPDEHQSIMLKRFMGTNNQNNK